MFGVFAQYHNWWFHPIIRSLRITFPTGFKMNIQFNILKKIILSRFRKHINKSKLLSSILILTSSIFLSLSAHAIGPYASRNDTVTDLGTGLQWQKNPSLKPHNWQNGLAYCENLSLDSHSDWRLPNIRELKSLVDYSRYYPAIAADIPCQSSIYWSATSVASDTQTSAWSVFFGNGDDIWKVKSMSFNVRCVRAGLLGAVRK